MVIRCDTSRVKSKWDGLSGRMCGWMERFLVCGGLGKSRRLRRPFRRRVEGLGHSLCFCARMCGGCAACMHGFLGVPFSSGVLAEPVLVCADLGMDTVSDFALPGLPADPTEAPLLSTCAIPTSPAFNKDFWM